MTHPSPHILRDAPWATPARLKAYVRLFALISLAMIVYWVASADGLVDQNGTVLGSDYLALHAAGELAFRGEALLAYDGAAHYALQQKIAGTGALDYAGFYYPPHYLLILAPLGALPYLPAFFVWMAASFGAAFAIVRTIVPRRETLLFAIGFPGTLINFAHGQNGFLSTALFGGALVLLDKRPVLSGVLFGLMTYKPHLGVLVPLVLLVTGRWTVILSAAITTAALLAATTLIFGTGIWPAMAAMSAFAQNEVLGTGHIGWHQIHSVYAMARNWGAGETPAYMLHAAIALPIAGLTIRAWSQQGAFEIKAALLVTAALLMTPYGFSYDLTLLGLPIAFLIAHGLKSGFAPYQKSLLALSFVLPVLSEPLAANTGFHIVPFALIGLFAHTLTQLRARTQPAYE